MAQELEITPFTTDHLDAAAALLAQRQMGLRAVRPELPPAFTLKDFRLHRHIDERIVWAGGRPG